MYHRLLVEMPDDWDWLVLRKLFDVLELLEVELLKEPKEELEDILTCFWIV